MKKKPNVSNRTESHNKRMPLLENREKFFILISLATKFPYL